MTGASFPIVFLKENDEKAVLFACKDVQVNEILKAKTDQKTHAPFAYHFLE